MTWPTCKRCTTPARSPWFDALAVHAYGGKFPPDEPAAPDAINFARTELLRDVMVANGDGDKPILITEAGWNDHPRWTRAVRPGQRIEYTVRAYQKVLDEWPWAEVLAFWAFRYPAGLRTYQDYFTFVTPDFQPKPIYLEVQRYSRGQELTGPGAKRVAWPGNSCATGDFWLAGGAVLLLALALILWRTVGQSHDRVWERIQQNGVWQVAMDPSFPPFEALDDEGRPVGFDVDLAQAIAAALGRRGQHRGHRLRRAGGRGLGRSRRHGSLGPAVPAAVQPGCGVFPALLRGGTGAGGSGRPDGSERAGRPGRSAHRRGVGFGGRLAGAQAAQRLSRRGDPAAGDSAAGLAGRG